MTVWYNRLESISESYNVGNYFNRKEYAQYPQIMNKQINKKEIKNKI